jgi:hypothetical protein
LAFETLVRPIYPWIGRPTGLAYETLLRPIHP